ncbi:MAG TPA: lytic transglycosylase domain-containing protein [Solirubrobacterales bacterium]|nr:lytic transglycosylase domain-containing protein [Solirubrobacterales bacterium]
MSRRRARRSPNGRRRWLTIAVTVVLGLGIGVALVNGDEIFDLVSDRLREVTLPLRHEDIIRQQAAEKDIPPDLIAAVIYQESRFHDQESHAGARGLMQVTPETAEFIERDSGGSTFVADDLSDPDINIRYGTYYLRYLMNRFDGNMIAALAAYNAGETNVESWGGADLQEGDIEFDETRDYVDIVLEKRDEYREHYAEELGLD